MNYKKILTIQDVSCVGQCSLTVALPIISVCGIETAILPSAVLSTHTGGFTGYTFHDLTEDMPPILAHWKKENICFEAIYTGYLGSTEQIEYVKNSFDLLAQNGKKIVDPAMADNGKLYPAFNDKYVGEMKKLCGMADVVLPNVTEACFLTDSEYKTIYDKSYIEDLCKKLCTLGAKTVVMTGVGFSDNMTGVAIYENGTLRHYEHKKISKGCHGTGDVYASAFVGAFLQGKDSYESAVIAADYTVKCIENTQDDPTHWYGVKFETALSYLMEKIK